MYRYVDDTFTFIKPEEISNVVSTLNRFHKDIQFTHEVEQDSRIAFLDVGITKRENGSFQTDVHRKRTDTNLYVNWKAFAPVAWKLGTVKGLIRRAFLICSEKEGLDRELKHLKSVFTKINGYPSKVFHRSLKRVENAINREKELEVRNTDTAIEGAAEQGVEQVSFPYMCLPYKGNKGEDLKIICQKFYPRT